VILFHSTHHALKSEKVFKNAGLGVDVIPVPREFSANCGISACLDWKDRDRAEVLLLEEKIPVEGIRRWERD